jgi:4-hydroxyphenylpyruvate dioxygenase
MDRPNGVQTTSNTNGQPSIVLRHANVTNGVPNIARDHTITTNGHSISNGNSIVRRHDSLRGYDHIRWYVGNAKQAASYYITRLGFRIVAYEGLETGSRCCASYVITNGTARFILTSPILRLSVLKSHPNPTEKHLVQEMYDHLSEHGDAVKDVAFEVDDVHAIYNTAVAKGAVGVKAPYNMHDNNGSIELATIQTYGDTTHTFIGRSRYNGVFMPGFRAVDVADPSEDYLPVVRLDLIDHFVGNQDWNGLESACKL